MTDIFIILVAATAAAAWMLFILLYTISSRGTWALSLIGRLLLFMAVSQIFLVTAIAYSWITPLKIIAATLSLLAASLLIFTLEYTKKG